MTTRQKEFARLYASGLPAAAAAHAAGYAKVTAERNAAAFLEHPRIAARIAEMRARRNVITPEDLYEARDQIMQILRFSGDPLLKLKASDQLCKLTKMQARVEIERQDDLKEEIIAQDRSLFILEDQIEKHENLKEYLLKETEKDMIPPHIIEETLHKNAPLPLDNEGLILDKNYIETPRSHDHLPSGALAFDHPLPSRTPAKAKDIRLAYRKLAMAKLQKTDEPLVGAGCTGPPQSHTS